VWVRIGHVAADGYHHALGDAAIREQTVEIALGPKGAFKSGNVGALTRRVAANRIVSALPEPRYSPKQPKEPKRPRVVGLLAKAVEWRGLLESGQVRSQAEIARREGITRARVTQIMALLRLAPEIQEWILTMPEVVGRPAISERALRPIAGLESLADQKARFEEWIPHTE
jgi:hypothetical protein